MQGYEERSYPSVNYACTEMTYNVPEETEPWGVLEVIRALVYDNLAPAEPRPQSTMFRRLFGYMFGDNREGQNIQLTTPFFTKLAVSDKVTVCNHHIVLLYCCIVLIDHQHHVCIHQSGVPVKPSGAFGVGGEDCEEQ